VKMERLHLPTLSGPVIFDSGARLLAVAFSLAAVILAGRWLTELTAPRPVAELPSTPMTQPDSNLSTISRLFGTGTTQSQALEGLHLTGVFAGSRGGGFATIHTRAGDMPVFRGDEVAPGVIVKQIESDRVILLNLGTQKELRLQEGYAPVVAPAPQASPSNVPAAAPAPAPRASPRDPRQPVQEEAP
jgi:hypothetical protein